MQRPEKGLLKGKCQGEYYVGTKYLGNGSVQMWRKDGLSQKQLGDGRAVSQGNQSKARLITYWELQPIPLAGK